jgi:hypothetical protein
LGPFFDYDFLFFGGELAVFHIYMIMLEDIAPKYFFKKSYSMAFLDIIDNPSAVEK